MIEQNTQQQKLFKILLIGDNCIDEYQYGKVDRLSPEAPVPIFKPINKEVKPGMGANVQGNLLALGCIVNFITGAPSKKLRLIDQRSKQHMMRIDDDAVSDAATLKDVGNVEMYDAIVISDYNKGVVTYDLIQQLRALFAGPIFVDTKKTDLEKFEGCIVKINQLEHSLIKTTCTDLIVTMGRRGANYNDVLHPAPEVDVADVCGAGDTFLSSLVVAFLETQNIEYAIQFANMAASISVQHSGVYILSQQDISYIYETLNYGV